MKPATPSQTIGPFFHVAMAESGPGRLVGDGVPSVMLHGRVLDGREDPVDDALVEMWDATSRRFARCSTDKDGGFSFVVAAENPPDHLAVSVFARGLLGRLVTRCYLTGSPEVAAATDPALAAVPQERQSTLAAQRTSDGFQFDIRLQGDRETVFFAW